MMGNPRNPACGLGCAACEEKTRRNCKGSFYPSGSVASASAPGSCPRQGRSYCGKCAALKVLGLYRR